MKDLMLSIGNEAIFLFHIALLAGSTLIAFRSGKTALIALLCGMTILENLFVVKQISLFGLCVTCTDAFAVGGGLCLNLIQEYYGRASARSAVWISFGIVAFYLIVSQIHLIYTPMTSDCSQASYELLLGIMPRIVAASLVSYLLTQQVDYRLYAWLKTYATNSQVLRNYGSLLISQLLDTVCFSILGLWGIVGSLTDIIILSYIIKVITIIVATPLIIGAIRRFNVRPGTE